MLRLSFASRRSLRGGATRRRRWRRRGARRGTLHSPPLPGGALLEDDGIKRTGSCLIINVPSRAAAEDFSRDEPFRSAGLFKTVKIARMRRGQWNPAAAPQTAEGN